MCSCPSRKLFLLGGCVFIARLQTPFAGSDSICVLLIPSAVVQADVHLAHIMQRAAMLPPGTRPPPPSTLVSAGGSAIANVYSTGATQQHLNRDPEAGISLGPSISPSRTAGARRGESAQVDAGQGADLRVGSAGEMVAAAQRSSRVGSSNGNGIGHMEAHTSVVQPAGVSSSLNGSEPMQSPVAESKDASLRVVPDDLATAMPLADQQERLGSSTDALLQEQQQERAASHGAASTSQLAGAAASQQGDLGMVALALPPGLELQQRGLVICTGLTLMHASPSALRQGG